MSRSSSSRWCSSVSLNSWIAWLKSSVVEIVGLQERQQGLVTLLVLLLAVLGLALVDGVPALELRVDLGLLGLAVRHQQLGDLVAERVPVVLLVAQGPEQILEDPVVGEDQLDDVAGLRSGDLDGARARAESPSQRGS